tara:strand:- start:213 stop:437 length:225 start_codon:yes stop_codon:yes gene_type:complete
MITDEKKVYQDLFEHALHLLNDHTIPVELVAGTMMAIGQRLYKTSLNDDEYERMIDFIKKTKVEPYNVEKISIH